MSNPYIVDRALPERSKLKFYFPKGGTDYFVATIPLYENPTIRESKRARVKTHSLISRSSNLYTYHGADSRKFDITFNITFPHILEEHGSLNSDDYMNLINSEDRDQEKKRFSGKEKREFGLSKGTNMPKSLASSYRNLDSVQASAKKNIKSIFGADPLQQSTLDEIEENVDKEKNTNTSTEATTQKYNTINVILYWINIIRSSLSNNASNPLLGPPILRIIHGTLYRDIPCICTDYNLEVVEAAGYDVQSLMPRQIRVNLKVEEFRAGEFGVFNAESPHAIQRDNLAGWEAVISGRSHSADPGVADNTYFQTVAVLQALYFK